MSDYAKCTWGAARVNAGISSREACNALHIAPNTLTSYEQYKTFPSTELAQKMCRLYGKPIDYIFMEKPSK